jgi:hypothetical protein
VTAGKGRGKKASGSAADVVPISLPGIDLTDPPFRPKTLQINFHRKFLDKFAPRNNR